MYLVFEYVDRNLLEILEERGFSVANYSNFSITDVGILTENNQLDMLLENSTINKKIYVKYYVTKLIKLAKQVSNLAI